MARRGQEGQKRIVGAGRGEERMGVAEVERPGKARTGGASIGLAEMDWRGRVWRGAVW